jgi:CcmD family protein
MAALVTAYLLVWLAVAMYVLRLGARQHSLLRRLESVERRLDRPGEEATSATKAA